MIIISKTTKKIVLEMFITKLKKNGFDKSWDEIRKLYPAEEFIIENIEKSKFGDKLLITLEKKKNISTLKTEYSK